MALVKDVYNLRFYNQLTDILQGVFPLFEKDNFIKDIFSTGFDNMEYKERMRHTTQVLHSYMPDDYPKAVEILLKLTGELEKVAAEDSLIAYIFLPDYVELYGIDDYETNETDKIVKHACRTLFKQGHPDILKLYGLNSDDIYADNLTIKDSEIKMGDSLTFSFEIENGLDKELDVRIEYAIYYMKANASRRTRRSGHYQW